MNEENQPQEGDSGVTRPGASISDVMASQYGAYTSTPQQAANAMTEAGFPIDPRSVKRNCKSEILDCDKFNGKNGEKWMVNPESVVRRIQQLKQYQEDDTKSDVSGRNRTRHDVSGHVTPDTDVDKQSAQSGTSDDSEVEFLKDQIRKKDEQIDRKDKQIDAMLTRDMETNILLKNMQQLLTQKQLGEGEGRQHTSPAQSEEPFRDIPTENANGDNSTVGEMQQ